VDQTPDAAELGTLALFSGLRGEELEALASTARVESYAPGAIVFSEGDPPGDLYVIEAGRVTLSMRVPGRSETSVLSLRPGELLGWSALLRRPRVATARVVAPATLLAFHAPALLELCERDVAIGYRVMRQAFEELADRLSDTRLQLLDVFGRPR
jgi:CRP/FNR family cyclic AMP-dependent transcriptional regulator